MTQAKRRHREPDACIFCDRTFSSKQGRAHHERWSHPGLVTPEMKAERAAQSQREHRARCPKVRTGRKWKRTPANEAAMAKYAASARGKAVKFARHANERAVAYGVDGRLTVAAILAAPVGACTYCGATERVRWDHVIPMSRGGPNTVENLVPCCFPCNRLKGDQAPEEWAKGGPATISGRGR